jgi:hypothetical protein
VAPVATFDAAERTPQTSGELGSALENNRLMNRAIERMSATVARRRGLYERSLPELATDRPPA